MTGTDNIEVEIEHPEIGWATVPLHTISCPDQVKVALAREGLIETADLMPDWTMGDFFKWLGRETGADL